MTAQRAMHCATAPSKLPDATRRSSALVDPAVAALWTTARCSPDPHSRASMLAFRPHERHWFALAAGFGDGLGAPADELRILATAVTEAVTDRGHPAGRS